MGQMDSKACQGQEELGGELSDSVIFRQADVNKKLNLLFSGVFWFSDEM